MAGFNIKLALGEVSQTGEPAPAPSVALRDDLGDPLNIMKPFILPPGYDRIKVVHSFAELVNTPWRDGVNAICWQRSLAGDFDEVVAALLSLDDGDSSASIDRISNIEPEQLKRLRLNLSAAGKMAVDILIQDLRLLIEHGLEPNLDCIHYYTRDDPAALVATDVYSFHADSAPIAADTWLCAYTEAASEGLRNDQAQRRVEIPATRAALLQQFGVGEGEDFQDYLSQNCYDLHYAPMAQAQPFSFGLGNLWRIAIEYPACPVPPCIHRAPETLPGRGPRLLLIS